MYNFGGPVDHNYLKKCEWPKVQPMNIVSFYFPVEPGIILSFCLLFCPFKLFCYQYVLLVSFIMLIQGVMLFYFA